MRKSEQPCGGHALSLLPGPRRRISQPDFGFGLENIHTLGVLRALQGCTRHLREQQRNDKHTRVKRIFLPAEHRQGDYCRRRGEDTQAHGRDNSRCTAHTPPSLHYGGGYRDIPQQRLALEGEAAEKHRNAIYDVLHNRQLPRLLLWRDAHKHIADTPVRSGKIFRRTAAARTVYRQSDGAGRGDKAGQDVRGVQGAPSGTGHRRTEHRRRLQRGCG